MDSVDANDGKTFWKKNSRSVPGSIKAVYGAMHPPLVKSPKGSPKREVGNSRKDVSGDSFQDFQASVNDAWDCADDEFSVFSHDIKISNQASKSAALSVIHSHMSGKLKPSNESQDVISKTNKYASTKQGTVLQENQSNISKKVQLTLEKRHTNLLGNDRDVSREERFEELLRANKTDLAELRKLSWSGIPPTIRADVWRILSGYLPANAERREETLKRKRDEYWSYVRQYYNTRHDDLHQDTYRQIHIDIPRMAPLMPLFQQSLVQETFERILYIWAIRHPASGYVQGMNDLVTPFFVVFLFEFILGDAVLDTYDVSLISEEGRAIVEADSFWCMNKLMDGIQDNYTFAQPGIQMRVNQLRELIRRIDVTLHKHLEFHEIDYLQFSFRWFNNLLMREVPLGCIIRLWDTLHAEPDGFSHFVFYVCAAFLTHFSTHLLNQKDFQSLMILLQNLPTDNWSDNEISVVLAEAFRLKYVFADAPNHLQSVTKL